MCMFCLFLFFSFFFFIYLFHFTFMRDSIDIDCFVEIKTVCPDDKGPILPWKYINLP